MMLSKRVASAPELLARGEDPPRDDSLQLDSRIEQLEARLIREALTRVGGNRSRAAKLLGISRNGLAIKMQRLGIKSSKEL
jgi:DNA-binding NtrC family response regulator